MHSFRRQKPPLEPKKSVGFADVLARLEEHSRPYDRNFLQEVFAFTEEMHKDQRRQSGEPYVSHPVYVAYVLADLKFDQTCVAVGLLHDVLEDTLTTKSVLVEKFGGDIADLVDAVTKIGRQEYVRRDDAQAETFRKMILASARDLRVILVKLADRLHNMLTLDHLPAEKKRRIAAETLEIYAPIAMRLGMSKVQGDLEDLAFYHRYPLQFAELAATIREKMRVGKDSISKIHQTLESSLKTAGVDADISYRVKRYYSIYRKLKRREIDISQLYDYLAFRVITTTLKDTYVAFGTVHQNWRPVPGRFKDYIAMPKPNLYQSLHTTVVGSDGQPFEVQIRTREMDLVAEEGIAAHWQYKEGRQGLSNDPNIVWLRQLLEWQKEVEDPREFLSALKIDLYPDEVYVFSPKGDVHSFPRGATPLDFAYRIHTDLGHRCAGARVNGKLVPLRTELQNGDQVEIMTNPTRQPSRDWLSMVVTTRARSKIRQWLNTEQKRQAEAVGRRLFERELKRLRINLKKALDSPELKQFLLDEGLSRNEELFQRLGYGKLQLNVVLPRIFPPEQLSNTSEPPGVLRRAVDRWLTPLARGPLARGPLARGPVTVKGEGDLLTYLAKCCHPVPGEDIVGYVTRGKGIAVHSRDCSNISNLLYDPERLIEVDWSRQAQEATYPVSLLIETEDQPGMLARLTEVIAKEASNIRQFEAETIESGKGLIGMVLEVRNSRHLDRLQQAISGIVGVIEVSRRPGATPRSSGLADRTR